jgi:hypothetical protein
MREQHDAGGPRPDAPRPDTAEGTVCNPDF